MTLTLPANKRKLINAPIIGVDGSASAEPIPVGTRIAIIPAPFFTDANGMVVGTTNVAAEVYGFWTGYEWKYTERLNSDRYSQSNVWVVASNYSPYQIRFQFPSGAQAGPYTYIIKESDSPVYDLRFAVPEEYAVESTPLYPSESDLLTGRMDYLQGILETHTTATGNPHQTTALDVGAIPMTRVAARRTQDGYGIAPLDENAKLPAAFLGDPNIYGALALVQANQVNGYAALDAYGRINPAQLPTTIPATSIADVGITDAKLSDSPTAVKARTPAIWEKDALAGSAGTPSAMNRYLTNQDATVARLNAAQAVLQPWTFTQITVSGAASLSTAAVTGNATVGGTLTVTGATTFGSTVIFQDNNLRLDAPMKVVTTIGTAQTVYARDIRVGSTYTVLDANDPGAGGMFLNGNLKVNGTANFVSGVTAGNESRFSSGSFVDPRNGVMYGVKFSQGSAGDFSYLSSHMLIGTTTRSVNNRLTIQQANSTSGNGIRLNNADASLGLELWSGATGAVVEAISGNLHLRTASVDRLFIASTTGFVGIGTSAPSTLLDVSGVIQGTTLNAGSGTLRLQESYVTRWTVESNNGILAFKDATAGFATRLNINPNGDAGFAGVVSATRLISTINTGTAPMTVTSTTAVTNLNADMVDGMHAFQLAFEPLGFSVLDGVIVERVGRELISRVQSGTVTVTYANAHLGVASTNGSVVAVVRKNGTEVWRVTFAQGSQTPVPTWASGSSFTVARGDLIEYAVISAGTGAQDLTVVLDV